MSPQRQDGQFTKQSVADLFGWDSPPPVPDALAARLYYDSVVNAVHIIDSNGNDILGSGGGVSFLPIGDQIISGPFALVISGGTFQVTPQSFASLPTPSPSLEGTLVSVSDSNTNTWGAAITGTGSFHVLAYCNSVAWTVAAK